MEAGVCASLLPVEERVNRGSTGALPAWSTLRLTVPRLQEAAVKPHRTIATAHRRRGARRARGAGRADHRAGLGHERRSRSPPTPPAVTTTIDEGFDWGSAAIGAGGAGALIALVSLGGFAYSSRGRMPVPR